MAKRKQLTVSMAALRAYQPKGQNMRYPFGAESLAKLDEYISLKITAPGYNHAELLWELIDSVAKQLVVLRVSY